MGYIDFILIKPEKCSFNKKTQISNKTLYYIDRISGKNEPQTYQYSSTYKLSAKSPQVGCQVSCFLRLLVQSPLSIIKKMNRSL